MIQVTENAVNAIRNAISGSSEPVEGLRIMVQSGGCAGYKYLMGLVKDAEPGDAVIEQSGIKVFVDEKSIPLLTGVVLDFSVSLEGAGFTFDNPNAEQSCSCGKSFS